MERNNIIIILIAIVLVIGLGAVLASTLFGTQYEEFSDSNIKVEIPSKYDLAINENNNETIKYSSLNNELGISLQKFNSTDSKSSYDEIKTKTKNSFINDELASTEHNYTGEVYKVKSNTSNEDNYVILIFDDANKVIIVLSSNNLDTVINMANTFELLNINFSIVSTNTTNTSTNPNSKSGSDNANSGNNSSGNSEPEPTPGPTPDPEPEPEPTPEPTILSN